MKKKKKTARKGRLALTLSLSVFVFIINTVALLFAIVLVYCLTRLGAIDMSSGQMGLSAVLTVISLTSLVIGFLLTVFTSKIPLRPVNSLVDQLDRLSEGDFGARLHFGRTASSHPTFQQIETSFNRAAEELEHTEMLRSDFIDNFSHEFKTPIVSIAGFAKLLRRGNLTEEQRAEYIFSVIEEESLRLSALANNVLSLTRVENQTILTDISEFNLSEQIRGAVLLLADKWTAKDLNIDLGFDECLVDPKLLRAAEAGVDKPARQCGQVFTSERHCNGRDDRDGSVGDGYGYKQRTRYSSGEPCAYLQ